MNYIIADAELAKMYRAIAKCRLALEPKPGYKAGSREVLIAALENIVAVVDALELDEVDSRTQASHNVGKALEKAAQEKEDRLNAPLLDPGGLPMTREQADAQADAFVDMLSEITGKNIVAVDCTPEQMGSEISEATND